MMLRKEHRNSIYLLSAAILVMLASCKPAEMSREQFEGDLKIRTFNFFWDKADEPTGQIPDRFPTRNFTSIAATGFGLTSYIIGVENNYISRDQAVERVEKTLNWLWNSKQGPEAEGISGYQGFYYHFLTYGEGIRFKTVELSTVDTGWLLAGILACQSYFSGTDPREERIRALADSIYLRVNWEWAMEGQETMSMGWHPEKGFIPARWIGYNESMMVIILGLGSPTHAIHDSAWQSWCKTYEWMEFKGMEFLNFGPLFGHQYSHMFIDFRGIYDPFISTKGIDYFENSRRATLSNRQYCIDNPGGFKSYSENIWGLSACDGPADVVQDGKRFHTYWARGAGARYKEDDGTITPTAAGGSIPFAPDECINALFTMKITFGDKLYQEYGFKDAFNMTYKSPESLEKGWFDIDYLGIDQGPIIIQLENYHSELIWNIMKTNPYIINGLKKAGFRGGWLDKS